MITSPAPAVAVMLRQVVDLGRRVVTADFGLLQMSQSIHKAPSRFASGFRLGDRAAEVRHLRRLAQRPGQEAPVWDISSEPPAAAPRDADLPESSRRVLRLTLSYQGDLLGWLYLARRADGPAFSGTDGEAARMFAVHSAAAIDNLRQHPKVRYLAVLEEQDRIAKELQDGVIQSIYAIGIDLEDLAGLVEKSPQEVQRRLADTINSLNNVIRDLRSSIFGLAPLNADHVTLAEGLRHLAEEYRVHSLLEPEVAIEPPAPIPLTPEQRGDLLRITREALANTSKHARANRVRVHVAVGRDRLTLSIQDNGIGFDPQLVPSGRRRGLQDIHELAQGLGGSLTIDTRPGQGTRLVLEMPIPALSHCAGPGG